MTAIILDASALLAMLRSEPGGDAVAATLGGGCMSVVNLAEVVSHFIHNGMPPDAVSKMLNPLPIELVAADADLAHVAGQLRDLTSDAGLSLGDRFCLALALRRRLPAWTADKQWATIANRIGAEIVVIR